MNIEYKVNCSNEKDIFEHFNNCDKEFISYLQKRVNISEYSKKIFEKAIRYEAWAGNILAGLIAIYTNEKKGYITDVSVIEQYKHQKIATNILNMCIESLQNIKSIKLEVLKNNKIAIDFYKKNGFRQTNETNITIYMEMENNKCLNGKN